MITWKVALRNLDRLHILNIKRALCLPDQKCEKWQGFGLKKTAQSTQTAPNHMKTPNLTVNNETKRERIRSKGYEKR
jgi:hypothetical protein